MRSWLFLALFPAAVVAEGLALAGETCGSQDDCMGGLQCFNNVCLNRGCIIREAREVGAHFNGNEFRDQLLDEAGLTKRDLIETRIRYINDNEAFVQSSEVQTFLGVINSHSAEMEEIATILQLCADEDPSISENFEEEDETEPGREFGDRVGNLMENVKHFVGRGDDRRTLQEQEHRRLQLVPSASPSAAPSSTPSMSPTFPLNWKTYLGFHMEAGILLDASYSVVYPNSDAYDRDSDISNSYGRWCVGAELGAGIEIGLIGLTLYNRENNDIRGNSNLYEFDAQGGFGGGFAVGVYRSGDATMNGNSRTHFEFTLGLGAGVGLGGGAYCETSFYTGPMSKENPNYEEP